jgi:hypothetical protein
MTSNTKRNTSVRGKLCKINIEPKQTKSEVAGAVSDQAKLFGGRTLPRVMQSNGNSKLPDHVSPKTADKDMRRGKDRNSKDMPR